LNTDTRNPSSVQGHARRAFALRRRMRAHIAVVLCPIQSCSILPSLRGQGGGRPFHRRTIGDGVGPVGHRPTASREIAKPALARPSQRRRRGSVRHAALHQRGSAIDGPRHLTPRIPLVPLGVIFKSQKWMNSKTAGDADLSPRFSSKNEQSPSPWKGWT
jgi:hypothetical protein